jgi:hypothetical protein
MNYVVIGTDRRFQHNDQGLEAILRVWLSQRYFEPLVAIAEEFHQAIGGSTVAQKLAGERNLRWFNVDMTDEERRVAGIYREQWNRPGMFQEAVTYRIPSDDVREEAWVRRLFSEGDGTVILICGYLHFESIVQKLRAKGNVVDKRVYLDSVPEIKIWEGPVPIEED